MEHPNPKCRKEQEEVLSQLPEEKRENQARFFRIGNAAYIYHQQALSIRKDKLEAYYEEWLESLPSSIALRMKMLGVDTCKTMLPFTRYVNERNDMGMCDWMKEHLSEKDFGYWLSFEDEKG